MEQPSKNSSAGTLKIPQVITPEREKNPWKLPRGANSYHASSDASLFSISLPVLPHGKFNFNESKQIGQSFNDDFPRLTKVHPQNEVKDLVEDFKPGTIGNILPGDGDELLEGLMDDFDLSELPTQIEDLDDDFFGSGGGLEIESDNHESLISGMSKLSTLDGTGGSRISQYGFVNGVGTVSGEHPYGEHPSRTLFVRNINSNVEDSELMSLFEQYGDIRKLYTACKHRGFVMISYYDIRAARTAMRALQNKPLRRRKLDIHFSIPKDNPSEKDVNQGTLVVFNLEASVSNDELRKIFGAFGEVKEIRETPHKRHHRFIEFYDVRAAEAALKCLNRCEIGGKHIKLEPSRPGGARRSLMQQLSQDLEPDEGRGFLHQVGSPVADSPPGCWPNFGSPVERNSLNGYNQAPQMGSFSPVGSNHNHVPGLASILPSHASSPAKIAPIGKDPGRISHPNQITQSHYAVSDPKSHSTARPVSPFDYSKPSSVGTLSGPQFLWGGPSTHSDHINSPAWPSSMKGQAYPYGGQGVHFLYTNQRGPFLGSQHHVASAPSGVPLERHFGFYPESSSYANLATYGVSNSGRNDGNNVINVSALGAMNIGPPSFTANFPDSSSSRRMIIPRNSPVYYGNGSFGATGIDGINGINRSRRAECGTLMDIKRQYQLDLEKILKGEDIRTTLMIKNIPNKYTSKMLLAAIDETHKGTYDFLYLPIDFKNKCNVGYAFINMVSPLHIITFYEAFNGKKWEKFNSEKVASLAYARIQGKAPLVSHFQNSTLMNEDKSCRPILFQSEGQEADALEPFPSGSLNIFIRQPDGSYTVDSLDSPRDDLDDIGS